MTPIEEIIADRKIENIESAILALPVVEGFDDHYDSDSISDLQDLYEWYSTVRRATTSGTNQLCDLRELLSNYKEAVKERYAT
jgi:hypothetical protein